MLKLFDCSLGRHSMNTENNAFEAFEHKRFSEPTPFINRVSMAPLFDEFNLSVRIFV